MRTILTTWGPGPHHSIFPTIWDAKMIRLLFGFHLYWAGRRCKNPQSIRGLAQCKSGPGNNMVSRCNHLFYHFSLTTHLHLASFYAIKYFWKKKKLASGNAHWTNYWIWIKGHGPPGRTCTPIAGYFHDKKHLRKVFEVDYYLLLKSCRWRCTLFPPTWAKPSSVARGGASGGGYRTPIGMQGMQNTLFFVLLRQFCTKSENSPPICIGNKTAITLDSGLEDFNSWREVGCRTRSQPGRRPFFIFFVFT